MYHSPQCQYKTTPFENIKFDETKAFAKLLLTSSMKRENNNSTKNNTHGNQTMMTAARLNKNFYSSFNNLTIGPLLFTDHRHQPRNTTTRLRTALRFLSRPIKKTSFSVIPNHSISLFTSSSSMIDCYHYLLIISIVFIINL
ncbi:unnamed protein product [Schistosoma turkestanicum]|nr:unnamed protein product [Schistosoma turkestanicum]